MSYHFFKDRLFEHSKFWKKKKLVLLVQASAPYCHLDMLNKKQTCTTVGHKPVAQVSNVSSLSLF